MFTAVMSLALLGVVALSGLIYQQAMAELFARRKPTGAKAPVVSLAGPQAAPAM